jgi:ATP/maltotriose-dependent transcriptional regulator MalT
VHTGEFASAQALGDEARAISVAISNPDVSISSLFLAGWRGREAEASRLIEASDRDAVSRGEGRRIGAARCAAAVLYNGLGRYEQACEAARSGAGQPREVALSNWCLPELVEAAVRSDQHALAEDARDRLEHTTIPSGTDWALGIQARCNALLSARGQAEGHYRDAIEHLGRTRMRTEHARAHLLFGEWLRREGRRIEAREHLRTAYEMFAEIGMEAFAERARRERLATGESIRKRRTEIANELTPQEAQIARLARAGLTNPEIGGQLFLSPRTVEWHLKKIFTKLGISSRRALIDAHHDRARDRLQGAT